MLMKKINLYLGFINKNNLDLSQKNITFGVGIPGRAEDVTSSLHDKKNGNDQQGHSHRQTTKNQ